MEGSVASTGMTPFLSKYLWVAAALVGALVLGFLIYYFVSRPKDLPKTSGFQDKKEGFYGGVARGAGIPDCLRTSSEGAQLYALFQGRIDNSYEEGPPDMRELTLMLSQISCFKKDLMGIAQQVEATRYQPFNTQIDMEPIAETTARCFAKTIPPRDLDLIFEKWNNRGHFLLARLCTAAGLREAEVKQAEALFMAMLKDVADVAKSVCLTGTPIMDAKPLPRDTVPYMPSEVSDLREYKGLY